MRRVIAASVVILALSSVGSSIADPPGGTISLVSTASDGTQGVRDSYEPDLSADGRFVAFTSTSWNLADPDNDGWADVFVKDRQTGETINVSVTSDGLPGSGSSYAPAISGDGRFIAFESTATNLVPGDTNWRSDVFVHDIQTGLTERVSVAADGSQADNGGGAPRISHDGRYVAYHSYSTNLVTDDTNSRYDIFVYDRQTGTTERVSVGPGGIQADGSSYEPDISSDGSVVVFLSQARNLDPLDTSGGYDAYLHDRTTGVTELISQNTAGEPANGWTSHRPVVSDDGTVVAFVSSGWNLAAPDGDSSEDIFVRDRVAGTTILASISADGSASGNNRSIEPVISGDGRFIAFQSRASNLDAGDVNNVDDVFLFDRVLGRVSVLSAGAIIGNDDSMQPAVNADGRYVAFRTEATNLFDDNNGPIDDVAVRDRGACYADDDADCDDDGLSDDDERALGTDPSDADSDDDGLSDGDEVAVHGTDPLDHDSDRDGLSDGEEVNEHETDPNDADSDDDGLSDYDEVRFSCTDPNDPETVDGIPDEDAFLVHAARAYVLGC